MFVHSITALIIASILIGQNPLPGPQVAPAAANNPSSAQGAPVPAAHSIIVPTGTVVPLTLMSAVKSKSTKPGDTVRAVVAFPVTVGTQLAIPAGTFVEGAVTQVTAKAGKQPSVRIHFTRLLFSNGYSATLNGENTQSFLLPDGNRASTVEVAELTPMPFLGVHLAIGEGQQPTMPTFPHEGPNPAVIGGAIAGAFAAGLVGMLVWAHHRANSYDFVVFDAGWQFQMILDSPVTLDAAQVAAAAAAPSAN